jgi:hypothetical protein
MELNGDETIAELAALRVAVKRLLEVANDQSVEKGQFARNALKKGACRPNRYRLLARTRGHEGEIPHACPSQLPRFVFGPLVY